jgi:hypothetical protein
MKSERRHELQHNELAEWLVKSAQTIKPYQNIAFTAVMVVLIGVIAYAVWSRVSAAQTAQAWDALNAALNSTNPDKLTQVVDDYPHTTVAHMAGLVLADYALADGCNQLFINKIKGKHELSKAVELYQTVREESREPSLLERAPFGLARAKESLGDAEHIKQAEQLYEEVAAKTPSGAFTAAAAQRLADLKRPATKSLYDQFAHFEPRPALSPESGGPPSFDLNSLPSEPSAAMPKTTYDLKLGEPKSKLPLLTTEPDTAKEKEKAKEKGKKETLNDKR